MGCGKSTVGPELAKRLGWTFVDLDHVIERLEGQSIPSIFATRGEQAFREAETRALQTLPEEQLVVALGGGAFLSEHNRREIRARGVSVWLDVSTGELVARILRSRRSRPILQEHGKRLTGDDLTQRVETLLASRTPAYSQADIRLEIGSGSTASDVADRVEKAVREHE